MVNLSMSSPAEIWTVMARVIGAPEAEATWDMDYVIRAS